MYWTQLKESKLLRLEQIGESLRKTGKARALIGFGSMAEQERIDAYSDLDFLVIPKKEYKTDLIDNLDWLTSISPVGYYYQFTADGYKLFYEDGIFCDFGILEADEVKQIPHGTGRIIWSEEGFDPDITAPTYSSSYDVNPQDINYAVGEILSSLYVGLSRYARGEKLSATRHIQNIALDKLLACSQIFTKEEACMKDPFQNERRYEQRFPAFAASLTNMIQGYERCPESALEIISFLEEHTPINPFMKKTITEIAEDLIVNRS